MNEDRLYQVALSIIPKLSLKNIRLLLQTAGSAKTVFDKGFIRQIPDLSSETRKVILDDSLLSVAENELKTMEKHGIKDLFILDEDYPYRLAECPDAPIILYSKGLCNLNEQKIVSIVGTRHATPHGKETTQMLIRDLSRDFPNMLIVSGLAYGIDAISHQASLEYGLRTVGVLAHGLHEIYPPSHRKLANDMIAQGGQLLSEHPWGTPSIPHYFRQRNRIIAGLCDVCIVIESATDGGSLITAKFAREYDRDVLAFPGRTIDKYSRGCNDLIKKQYAGLIESSEDVLREMNWSLPQKKKHHQQKIFFQLSPPQKLILDLISVGEIVSINEIQIKTNLKVNEIITHLLELEMEGLTEGLPGGCYRKKSL